MDATLRRLVEADVEGVVALTLAAWVPVLSGLEAQLSPALFASIFPDWCTRQATVIRRLCRSAGNRTWVAVLDERPVGVVVVGFVLEDATRAGEIHLLAVHPRHQRAGIGEALVQQALGAVRDRGAHLGVVLTGGDPAHAPARALYDKLGFEPLHLIRYYKVL